MDRHVYNKMIWGLVFIGAGVLFLLDKLQILSFDLHYVASTYWPVILIAFGLRGIVTGGGRGGSVFWSGLLLLLGVFFLLRNLDVGLLDNLELSQLVVPAVLILIGFGMISGARGSKRRYNRRHSESGQDPFSEQHWRADERARHKFERKMDRYREKMERKFKVPPAAEFNGFDSFPEGNVQEPAPQETAGAAGSQWSGFKSNSRRPVLQRSTFIGDVYLGQDYWTLEPILISHFIGDTVIDLTKAIIPFGETKIVVSSFIGDTKVFLPNDIHVEISVQSNTFIGETQVLDRLESVPFKTMTYESPYYADAEKKIKLDIHRFIGDVQIRRVG